MKNLLLVSAVLFLFSCSAPRTNNSYGEFAGDRFALISTQCGVMCLDVYEDTVTGRNYMIARTDSGISIIEISRSK